MSKSVAESKTECPLAFTDPRSPSAGISRTPIREVMRGTSSVKKSSSLCVVARDIFSTVCPHSDGWIVCSPPGHDFPQ